MEPYWDQTFDFYPDEIPDYEGKVLHSSMEPEGPIRSSRRRSSLYSRSVGKRKNPFESEYESDEDLQHPAKSFQILSAPPNSPVMGGLDIEDWDSIPFGDLGKSPFQERLGDGDLSAGEIEIPMLQKEPAQIKKSPRDPEEPRSKSHHRQGTPVISDSLSPNAKEGPSHDSVLSHKPGLISEAPKTDEDTDTIIRNASKPPTDHPQTLPSLNELLPSPYDDNETEFASHHDISRGDQHQRSGHHEPNITSGSSSPESDISMLSSEETEITQPQDEDHAFRTNDNQFGDLEHILNASAYYERLDMLELTTAEICGISKHPPEHNLTYNTTYPECLEALSKAKRALCNLQREGFCGDSFSILCEKPERPNVAIAIHFSIAEIDSLLASVRQYEMDPKGPTCDQDVLTAIDEKVGAGGETTLYRSERDMRVSQFVFISVMLTLGLVSFSGSHVCQFTENLWDQDMVDIPVSREYSYSLRQLACLKGFVGGPAWVLGRNDERNDNEQGLKVSLLVQDLQELWGPVWLVGGTDGEGSMIRTERGFIVPIPRGEQPDSSLGEIECHWAEDIPDHVRQANPIRLTSTSRILIGTETIQITRKVGLTDNPFCESEVWQIEERVHKQLQYSGTWNEFYTREGYDVQLTGGQYVTVGGIIRYKRNPMRTMKNSIVDACLAPATDINPLLKLNIGLEVSACTGNARRVTLWDVLRLSKSKGSSGNCEHEIASPKCIQSCWNCRSSDEDIRSTIVNSILALQHTGLDPDGNLQAYWPFVEGGWNHRISPTPYNKWLDILTDSRDGATFAVASQNCLVFQDMCAGPCYCPQSYLKEEQKTCLSIRLLPRPVSARDRGTRHRRFSIRSPSPECDLGELSPDMGFRVGKRSLTVNKAWKGRSRAMVANTNGTFGFRAPEFREQVNPDIKAGEPIEVIVCSKSFMV